jgi:hypothetical protein
MNRFFSVAGVLAFLLWGGTPPGRPVLRSVADQAESAAPALTDDSLSQMLNNMGLEPKKLSKGFLLAIKQDTWTINMQAVLSPDGRKLGLNANLGVVADPATVPASDWMNLLISNGDIDPSAFYFDKDQKKLYLHRSFDNRAITPPILRKEIDNFASNVRQTSALWSFAK